MRSVLAKAVAALGIGDGEILGRKIPTEAGNPLVERAAARALESKGLRVLEIDRRLNWMRHRMKRCALCVER